MHITLETGIYEIVNGKIPKQLIGYLPTNIELPKEGLVIVSVQLPNGGWGFEAVQNHSKKFSGQTLVFSLSHNGGASAAVVNQLVQVFEFSEACDFENITLSQDIPKTQSKLL